MNDISQQPLTAASLHLIIACQHAEDIAVHQHLHHAMSLVTPSVECCNVRTHLFLQPTSHIVYHMGYGQDCTGEMELLAIPNQQRLDFDRSPINTIFQ